MTNSLTADSIRDKIITKIRDTFIELIPAEAFKELVEQEVAAFTSAGSKISNRYGVPEATPSPFALMIQAELTDRFKTQIKAVLDGPEYERYWNGMANQAGPLVIAISQQLAPDMLNAMFAGLVQSNVNILRSCLKP